MITFCF